MPLFLSEEELRLYSNDGVAVAERADAFIRDLIHQRYTLLEQHASLLQSENAQLSSSAEQRLSELADAQIGKDGEMEETSELHKSKRQLLELLEQKDTEIPEKAIIHSYLDKIVLLNDKEVEIKETRTRLSEMQDHILKLEQDLAKCQLELGEQMKKLNDALQRETHLRNENKKQFTSYKILEKTLERERSKRQKNEAQMISLAQNVQQNKLKVVAELIKHKEAITSLLESKAVSVSQIPPTDLEKRSITYLESATSIEEIANSVQNDGGGTQSTPAEVSTTDTPASTLVSGRKVSTQQMRTSTPHAKVIEDKHKGFTVPKPSEVHK